MSVSSLVRSDEVCSLLCELIRVPSVGGKESEVARRIIDVLEREGITTYELIESAPGRGNLVVEIEGGEGERPTLMIVGHLDVVPAGEGWSVDPFAGVERDGWIYGRGAFDNKGQAAVMTYLAVALKRGNARFRGKLKLLFAADEEPQSPEHGVRFLVRERPDVFKGVTAAIGELGGRVRIGGRDYQVIVIGEKSSAVYELRFRGEAGHSSTPLAFRNPIDDACEVLSRIPTGVHFASKAVEPFLKSVIGVKRYLLRSGIFCGIVLSRLLKRDKTLASFVHALTHVTFAKTVIRGGVADNVIPEEVVAVVDVRGFPEQDERNLRSLLERFVRGRAEVRLKAFTPSTWSSPKHPLYHAIADVVRELGFEPLPFFNIATSDSAWLRRLGIPVFHFFVTKHEVSEFRAHGPDERIHRDDLMLALEGYLRLVLKYLRGSISA